MTRRLPLHLQILIALALSVLLGVLFNDTTRVFGVPLVGVLGFLGDMFLRALKMLVIPLIASSIIVGVASAGSGEKIGKLGLRTAMYYVASSFVAILIGLVLVVSIQPGTLDGQPVRDLIGLSADVSELTASVQGRGASDVVAVFLRMIPDNVIAEAAKGEMLGVIVFSLLFGIFATKIDEGPREVLLSFWQGVYEVMLKMTDFVLLFAPVGVLGLVGTVALTTGFSAVMPLLSFVATVLVALVVHAFVFVPLMLGVVARVNPRSHFRVMAPALLMAFSTASSSGTLPLTMERVRLLGVSQRVSSFTLPLGATVNMDGTALYECVAAVFIAQAYGIQLGFSQLLLVVVIALLTSIGVAGIPAASLVAISIILTSMGLPLEGLGLILAVDRVLDMCRTSVNVLGDSTAAVVVSRLEGDSLVITKGEVPPGGHSSRALED